ncbi:LacI family DNA-binding transcriptional regulator [Paraferrimonas sp. SM1919]|uniref:LacI family DNA-binding transcriptional regulator n=1 Tax=Paraferrimonas sp. SM1919 TaxID=2662263 RepID=UPI0013D71CBE|nr:LacI family DNA-binding transcriptional regulator [Paraferrimonas sp. SM1919]
MRKVTIKDVAKEAGVSFKTVSRVINKEGSVKAATLEKVTAAIKTLNYQPNAAARSLAGTKSYVIGFVYDNPNAYYVVDMQKGILAECQAQGYELLIHPCQFSSPNIKTELVELVTKSKLSGLILAPPISESSEILQALDEANIPYSRIIAGNTMSDSKQVTIMVDDYHSAQTLTEHLIELGHKDIAFFCGEFHHQSTPERLNGYRHALKSSGLAINENNIFEGKYSFNSGAENARKLLKLKQRPTAIVACNDEIAAGALFALRLEGVNIPDDISIVGFENSPFSQQTWPELTTMDQPTAQIAQTSTQLLIENLKGNGTTLTKVFEPMPIYRGSSAKAS